MALTFRNPLSDEPEPVGVEQRRHEPYVRRVGKGAEGRDVKRGRDAIEEGGAKAAGIVAGSVHDSIGFLWVLVEGEGVAVRGVIGFALRKPGIRAESRKALTGEVDEPKRTFGLDSRKSANGKLCLFHEAHTGGVPEGFDEGSVFVLSHVEDAELGGGGIEAVVAGAPEENRAVAKPVDPKPRAAIGHRWERLGRKVGRRVRMGPERHTHPTRRLPHLRAGSLRSALLSKLAGGSTYAIELTPPKAIERSISSEADVARDEEAEFGKGRVLSEQGQGLLEAGKDAAIDELPHRIAVAAATCLDRE